MLYSEKYNAPETEEDAQVSETAEETSEVAE